MTLLEEVKKMQQQGMAEDQIIHILRDKGIQYKDIAEALSQTKIKTAVEQPDAYPQQYSEDSSSLPTGTPAGMEPSIMSQMQPMIEEAPQEGYYPPAPTPQYAQQAPVQEYPAPAPGQEYAYDYSQYQQPAISADLISEIAEQVVVEKLSDLRKSLEKVIDMKTTLDAKIDFMDERLRKIEKTIDVLQSSVLKKVGDYVTNIQDIKTELIETQKTFSKLLPERRKPQPEHHPQIHHTQHTHHESKPHHPHTEHHKHHKPPRSPPKEHKK